MGDDSETSSVGHLGRIALKRVAVPRQRADNPTPLPDTSPSASQSGVSPVQRSAAPPERGENPANRLVPYLDLFARLDDGELSRLAGVPTQVVSDMRAQVDQIQTGLARYLDLIDRLGEAELVRLTQASPQTVRFWLLCQPKDRTKTTAGQTAGQSSAGSRVEGAAEAVPPRTSEPMSASTSSSSRPVAAPESDLPPITDDDDLDFALFDDDDDDLF